MRKINPNLHQAVAADELASPKSEHLAEFPPRDVALAFALGLSFQVRQLALMRCHDKTCDQDITVLVGYRDDGEGGYDFMPIAKLFDGNPFEQLEPVGNAHQMPPLEDAREFFDPAIVFGASE